MRPARFPFALILDRGTDDATLIAEFTSDTEAEKSRVGDLKDPTVAAVFAIDDWVVEERRATLSRVGMGLEPRPVGKPIPYKTSDVRGVRG